MEELFRFVAIRSADAVEIDDPSLSTRLDPDTDLRKSLFDSATQNARESSAQGFVLSDRFVSSPKAVPHGVALNAIADAFREMATDEALVLGNALTKTIDTLIATDPDFSPPSGTTDAERREALASYISGPVWNDTRDRISDSLLALRETEVQSRDVPLLADAIRAADLLRQLADPRIESINPAKVLASNIFLTNVRDTESADEPEEDETPPRRDTADLNLTRALEEVLRAPDSFLEYAKTEERFDPDGDGDGGRDEEGFAGIQVSRVPVLSQSALSSFSAGTQKTLSALNLDPSNQPLGDLVKTIRFAQKSGGGVFKKTGRQLVKGTKLPSKGKLSGILDASKHPEYLLPWLPITKGHVSPAGVGDLHVVRQSLKRYQGGDLAHIENVLQGEAKEREHRRRRYSEVEFTTETEVAISEERDTQTTERFELGLEVKRTAESEFGVGSDVTISASYGPAVEVESNTSFAYKDAKSQSHSRSVQMSKEIVDKASTAYSEKVRKEQRRKLVEEVEELNRHSLNAETADGHIIGTYQWVDKVYEAQVYNYGRRVLYDFMVPEPAAWFIWALSRRAEGVEGGLTTPPPFELSPADITEAEYEGLVALYEAKDVTPPPEPFVTVAYAGSGGPNPEKGPFVGADTITLPDGYQYAGHNELYRYTYKKSDSSRGFTLVVSSGLETPGQVPLIYSGHSLTGWSASVHVLCRRTDTAMEAWRQEVWNALHDGHRQQVAEYEEKLAALLAQEGVVIEGRNPRFNRKLESIELKKSCVALLSGSYPHWINSMIETGAGPIPNLNKSIVQGSYVRFMEQAFEWENLTYIFYPYYWARASKWEALMTIEDVDPRFLDFLTAGFARVVVPVRPGFESVVEHFRQTGKVWLGGKMPTITDPDYLPIAEEIKASLDAPGDEEPIGEPWDVIVPTQLVKLRDDNSLPEWSKQSDGTWAEV